MYLKLKILTMKITEEFNCHGMEQTHHHIVVIITNIRAKQKQTKKNCLITSHHINTYIQKIK